MPSWRGNLTTSLRWAHCLGTKPVGPRNGNVTRARSRTFLPTWARPAISGLRNHITTQFASLSFRPRPTLPFPLCFLVRGRSVTNVGPRQRCPDPGFKENKNDPGGIRCLRHRVQLRVKASPLRFHPHSPLRSSGDGGLRLPEPSPWKPSLSSPLHNTSLERRRRHRQIDRFGHRR